MKKFLLFAFIPAILLTLFTSCEKEGCTDSSALNYDVDAEENDGSCNFSRVGFYSSIGFVNGITISRVDVSVNGNSIGSTDGVYYPTGPGNCSATGTIPFQFSNGNSVDWNATVFLINGTRFFTSGQISPSSFSECIRVNMTR